MSRLKSIFAVAVMTIYATHAVFVAIFATNAIWMTFAVVAAIDGKLWVKL